MYIRKALGVFALATWLAGMGCSVDLGELSANHDDAATASTEVGKIVTSGDTAAGPSDVRDSATPGDVAWPDATVAGLADIAPDIAPDLAPDLAQEVSGAGSSDSPRGEPDGAGAPQPDLPDVAAMPDIFTPPDSPLFVDQATPADQATSGNDTSNLDLAGPADARLVPDASPPPAVVNLSQIKPVLASVEVSGEEAIFGNDGSSATSFCGSAGVLPVWWRVDLGAAFNIVRTEVSFANPASAYQYKIETSLDDSTYITAVDKTATAAGAGALSTDPFTAEARYLRITILGVSPTPPITTGVCFSEFSVWGYATPGTAAATLTNLALAGTAYRWSNNASAASNANRVAQPGLNNNSVDTSSNLAGTGFDPTPSAYEAAGVVLTQPAAVSSVVFVSGTYDADLWNDPDGNFSADFHLQLSDDGSTWLDATGWTLAPTYPYNATAANCDYVFAGSATGVVGVRVIGQVHPALTFSGYANARQVEVWGQP